MSTASRSEAASDPRFQKRNCSSTTWLESSRKLERPPKVAERRPHQDELEGVGAPHHQAEAEHDEVAEQGPHAGPEQVTVGGFDAKIGEADHQGEHGAGVDPEQAGFGQRIAGGALQHGGRQRKTDAHHQGTQGAGRRRV